MANTLNFDTEFGHQLDITGAEHIEITVSKSPTGKILWINVDGICRLRICRITGHIDCNLTNGQTFEEKEKEKLP